MTTTNAAPNATMEAALAYLEVGLSVLPLGSQEKRPDSAALIQAGNCSRKLVPCWKALQTRTPSPEELESWFRDPPMNLGIITGFRDTYALDFDVEEHYASWVEQCPSWAHRLPTQRTNRGYHVLFRLQNMGSTRHRILLPTHLLSDPEGPEVASFLGQGTWMVAWPSVHPRGSTYHWLEGRAPWDLGIPEVASMEELGLSVARTRPRVFDFVKRCFTDPATARSQFAFYRMRARGLETNRNRDA